jgi:hypothetical protein
VIALLDIPLVGLLVASFVLERWMRVRQRGRPGD